jgi:hypothetical protein
VILKFRVLALVPLIALVASGCASVGDRGEAASSVALALLKSVHGKDGSAACAMLAPETAAELQQSAGKPCAQAILDEQLPQPATVVKSSVYGQWAQVRLSDDTVFLAVFPGGWRVVAAGCTPRTARPYDCQLQGS